MHRRQAIRPKETSQVTIMGRPRPCTPTQARKPEQVSALTVQEQGGEILSLDSQEEGSELESVPNFRDLAWIDARIQPGMLGACMPYYGMMQRLNIPPRHQFPMNAGPVFWCAKP